MVALGIALSNLKGLGDEIWKWLGFFPREAAAGLHIVREKFMDSVLNTGYHCRAYQATIAVTFHLFQYL